MSDDDDRDSGKTGAFLLGFFFGVLVSLGAGGAFYVVQTRQSEMSLVEEQMVAREDYDRAMAAERAAKEAAQRAKAALEALEAKVSEDKDKK